MSFDAGNGHLFSALCAGSCVYIGEDSRKGIDYLFDFIAQHQISHAVFPYAVLNTQVSIVPESLQVISSGGGVLDSATVKQLGDVKLFNLYGPTEATVVSTYELVELERPAGIGQPISNTQVYVLSPSLELVPHGVVGELYIGGVGLARGYLNRPEQTAQSFIDNPFYELDSVNNSQRIYKTGDLVRVNQAGHLSFVGRVDEQVKLRGFRIECGEIESALNALDGVEHSAVLTDDNGTQLLGYVSLEEDAQWQNDTLKAAIAQYLPEYMIPNFIDVLADMPLTRNGKIDKQSWFQKRMQFEYNEFDMRRHVINVINVIRGT